MSAAAFEEDEVIDASNVDFVDKAGEELEEELEAEEVPAAPAKAKKKSAPRKKKDPSAAPVAPPPPPLVAPLPETYLAWGPVLQAHFQPRRRGALQPTLVEFRADGNELWLRAIQNELRVLTAVSHANTGDPATKYTAPIHMLPALHEQFVDDDPALLNELATDMIHDVAARKTSTPRVQNALAVWQALDAGKKK